MTRTNLGVVLATAAAATLLTLSACGSSGDTPGRPGGAAVTDEPSPTAATAPGASKQIANSQTTDCPGKQKPFTGEAADKFGPDQVRAGYCEMVKLAMEQSFVPDLLRKRSGFSPAEFSIPAQYMLPGTRRDWEKQVAALVANPRDVKNLTAPWTFIMAGFRYGDPFDFYPASSRYPAVLNQSFSPARTWVTTVDGNRALGMEFSVSADLVLTDGHAPYLFHVVKTLPLVLEENRASSDKPWLIAEYHSKFNWAKKPVEHDEVAAQP